MNAGDIAAISAAAVAVAGAIAGGAVSIIRELRINRAEAAAAAKISARRSKRRDMAIASIATVADELHVMGNSQRDATAAHTAVLTAALTAAGVPVPPIAPVDTPQPLARTLE